MKKVIITLILLFITVICSASDSLSKVNIMFWNVENYFSPFADIEGWTWKKFLKKRNDIAKVIMAVGEEYGAYPMVVGLAEVENSFVLYQLAQETGLARLDYGVIHQDSDDPRGIDVAILYRKKEFKPLKVEHIRHSDSTFKTRSILYVKGVVHKYTHGCNSLRDTLHIFVNHWPSKFGGEKASRPKRETVAAAVVAKLDSLRSVESEAKIIVMGDFNDTPDSKVITRFVEKSGLYRPTPTASSTTSASSAVKGTIRYRGKWELIDLFFVSSNLTSLVFGNIFTPTFLLEPDKTYLGYKPFRTYIGPRYNGGISDHLPIILNFPSTLPKQERK